MNREFYYNCDSSMFSNVVFEGMKRYYVEDLSERDYTLEYTAPYKITIDGDVIEEHAWGDLLCSVTVFLLEKKKQNVESLLEFKTDWTKKRIFSTQERTNCKKICGGVYLNCNHTALHSCWLLQDILDWFGVNKGATYFLIHRAPAAEPKDIRKYIENYVESKFLQYLMDDCNMSDTEGSQIVLNFKNVLNPILSGISKSYYSFFLFDDRGYLSNFIKKVNTKIENNVRSEIEKDHLKASCELLANFYKKYEKGWKCSAGKGV